MVTYNQYIDQIKLDGFRPCVIGAITCSGLIGLLRSNKYPGYEFVQGGVGIGETPIEAIEREVIEEMGFWFHKECHFPPKRYQFLFEDKLETKVNETLVTSFNKEIRPKGKHYLVYGLEINSPHENLPKINPEDFLFKGTTVKLHECRWVRVDQALRLVQTLTSPKKREIATNAIKQLEKLGYAK